MPKIDITRTELVWPGKYDGNGGLVPPCRVNLPFQVIERVNEARATRERRQEIGNFVIPNDELILPEVMRRQERTGCWSR